MRWSARVSVVAMEGNELFMDGMALSSRDKRIGLDNSSASVKVAHRCEERNSRVEIIPNPFGGVNTHLWLLLRSKAEMWINRYDEEEFEFLVVVSVRS